MSFSQEMSTRSRRAEASPQVRAKKVRLKSKKNKKAWKLKKAKAWHPNVDSKKPHQLHPVVIIILNLSRRDLVLVDKSAFWAGIQ